MSRIDLLKKMLSGSTTMPVGTNMGKPITANAKVHYHNGVPCNHDHSHDHSHDHNHAHHSDGSCCDAGDACAHDDHKAEKKS